MTTRHPDSLGPMMPTKTVTLDKAKVAAMLPLGVHVTHADVVSSWIDGALCARLEGYVLTEQLAADTEHATARVPASWWDHARIDLEAAALRLAGERRRRLVLRLVERLGVPKTKTLELSVTWRRAGMRPHSTLNSPGLGPVVYHEQTERAERAL